MRGIKGVEPSFPRSVLRGDALGVTREHGGLANVVQAQEQHRHTLET